MTALDAQPVAIADDADDRHPLARRDRITPEEIKSETMLLLGTGHCFRDHVLQVCPEFAGEGTYRRAGVGDSVAGCFAHRFAHRFA